MNDDRAPGLRRLPPRTPQPEPSQTIRRDPGYPPPRPPGRPPPPAKPLPARPRKPRPRRKQASAQLISLSLVIAVLLISAGVLGGTLWMETAGGAAGVATPPPTRRCYPVLERPATNASPMT